MKKHDNNDNDEPCRCARCRAIASGMTPEEADEAMVRWENECLIERGFYVHYVSDDPTSPTNFNAHTHGLDQFDEHLDFQVVVPLPPQVGHSILCGLANRVKDGERFNAGDIVDKVIRKFSVKLVEAQEDERKVLRIILPDFAGNYEPDKINEQYAVQYKDIPGVTIKPKPWIAYGGPKRGKSK